MAIISYKAENDSKKQGPCRLNEDELNSLSLWNITHAFHTWSNFVGYIIKTKSPSSVSVTIKVSITTFTKLEKTHEALESHSPYYQLYACRVVALNSLMTERETGINCSSSTPSQAAGKGEPLVTFTVFNITYCVPKTMPVVHRLGCQWVHQSSQPAGRSVYRSPWKNKILKCLFHISTASVFF